MKLDEAKQAQIEALYEDADKRNSVLEKIKSVKGRLKIFNDEGQLTVTADELENKLGMNRQEAQKEEKKPVRLTAVEKALKSLREAKNAFRRLNYEECGEVESELKKLSDAIVERRASVLDKAIANAENYLHTLQAVKAAKEAREAEQQA